MLINNKKRRQAFFLLPRNAYMRNFAVLRSACLSRVLLCTLPAVSARFPCLACFYEFFNNGVLLSSPRFTIKGLFILLIAPRCAPARFLLFFFVVDSSGGFREGGGCGAADGNTLINSFKCVICAVECPEQADVGYVN